MIILPGDVSAALIEHPMLEHPIATERSRVRPFDHPLVKTKFFPNGQLGP